MTLKIYQKGIWAPPSKYIDDAVRLNGLMQGHGATRAQGVKANFVRAEPQASKSNLTSAEPTESHQVGSGNGFSIRPLAFEINKHGCIQICAIFTQVQKTPGACHSRGSPRADRCYPWKLTLPGQNVSTRWGKSHHKCIEEAGGRGIKRNGATTILELNAAQAKWCGPLVLIDFFIFAWSQAEIQTNLHQVC